MVELLSSNIASTLRVSGGEEVGPASNKESHDYPRHQPTKGSYGGGLTTDGAPPATAPKQKQTPPTPAAMTKTALLEARRRVSVETAL